MSGTSTAAAFYKHFDRHANGKGLKGATTHYCPGCGHGLVQKYLAECITELGIHNAGLLMFCSISGFLWVYRCVC